MQNISLTEEQKIELDLEVFGVSYYIVDPDTGAKTRINPVYLVKVEKLNKKKR